MRISFLRRPLIHVCVFAGFVALSIAWTYPLVTQLSTHLPGTGVGDNAMFLWNFWWMRHALASGASFFHSGYLFAPAGVDLTLHTHTALAALIGATALARLPVLAALNITTIASLALNGFAAYLLAWRTVRRHGAAILAGVIFGTSPYIAAHLNGHFNLIAAWTIPLFAISVVEAMRGSLRWAALAGAVLAMTAYVDYYDVIYEIAFAGVVLLMTARQWHAELRAKAMHKKLLAALISAMAVVIVLIIATQVTGGFTKQLGPIRLSMHDPFNLAQLLAVLAAIAFWVRFGPSISAQRIEGWSLSRTGAGVAVMLGIFLAGIAPLLRNAIRLFMEGQYVTQHYQWRNAPVGIDVLTMFLANPFHGLWGGAIAQVYERLGINLVESGAWLGVVPVVSAVIAVRKRISNPVTEMWVALGGVFFVWALGSHIHAAGHNTGLIVPEVLLRYVPVAANARMPGRAIVVVYLALAVLAAIAVAHVKWRRPAALTSIACALVLADFWIAPFPTVAADCPSIYLALLNQPERGALAELPLGIADGFGALTPTDNLVLVCQTVHERPLAGGALARLPPNVMASYGADPLLSALLRLSGARPDVVPPAPLPDTATAGRRLAADGIDFIMLNRRTASAELRDFVERVMPLTLVAQDGERTLYRARPAPPVR